VSSRGQSRRGDPEVFGEFDVALLDCHGPPCLAMREKIVIARCFATKQSRFRI
jgi:hypothetical protein